MSSFMVGRYTLDSISLADLSPPQTCWLGHGRGRSPMTLPQRKAAGMHDRWRRYHRYSPKCVEEKFSEVGLLLNGVLGSSGTGGLAQQVGRIVGVSPVLHDPNDVRTISAVGEHLSPSGVAYILQPSAYPAR